MVDPVHYNWYQSGTVLGRQNTAGFRAPVSRKSTSVWGLPLSPLTFEQELERRMDRIFAPILKELELLKEEIKKEEVEITQEAAGEIATATTESGGQGGGQDPEEKEVQVVELEPEKREEKESKSGKQNSELKSVANLKNNIEGSRSRGGGDFADGFVGGGGSGGVAEIHGGLGAITGTAGVAGLDGGWEIMENRPARIKGRKKMWCAVLSAVDLVPSPEMLVVYSPEINQAVPDPWRPFEITRAVPGPWELSGDGPPVGSGVDGGGQLGGKGDGSGGERNFVGDVNSWELLNYSTSSASDSLLLEGTKGILVFSGKKDKLKRFFGDISLDIMYGGPHAIFQSIIAGEVPNTRSELTIAYGMTHLSPLICKAILTQRYEAHFLSFYLEFTNHPLKPWSISLIYTSKSLHPTCHSIPGAKQPRLLLPIPILNLWDIPTQPYQIHCELLLTKRRFGCAKQNDSDLENKPEINPAFINHLRNLSPVFHKPTLILNLCHSDPGHIAITIHLEDKVEVWAAGSGEYGEYRLEPIHVPQVEIGVDASEDGWSKSGARNVFNTWILMESLQSKSTLSCTLLTTILEPWEEYLKFSSDYSCVIKGSSKALRNPVLSLLEHHLNAWVVIWKMMPGPSQPSAASCTSEVNDDRSCGLLGSSPLLAMINRTPNPYTTEAEAYPSPLLFAGRITHLSVKHVAGNRILQTMLSTWKWKKCSRILEHCSDWRASIFTQVCNICGVSLVPSKVEVGPDYYPP